MSESASKLAEGESVPLKKKQLQTTTNFSEREHGKTRKKLVGQTSELGWPACDRGGTRVRHSRDRQPRGAPGLLGFALPGPELLGAETQRRPKEGDGRRGRKFTPSDNPTGVLAGDTRRWIRRPTTPDAFVSTTLATVSVAWSGGHRGRSLRPSFPLDLPLALPLRPSPFGRRETVLGLSPARFAGGVGLRKLTRAPGPGVSATSLAGDLSAPGRAGRALTSKGPLLGLSGLLPRKAGAATAGSPSGCSAGDWRTDASCVIARAATAPTAPA